ncbi:MAG: hemerythrin domain-containing protein [Candidatus Omnitrophica bacterium]|nr:MAG: hypothetical protein UZ16_OP3001000810 [Candidatus Hinthialibacteria bacterium OLB16]MBE7488516.1 hemerythrin domain-containing protein [bacterium]MBV6481212.1 hypothetical protein [bacterium]MCC6733696.1 hemerythrin domain-containing protein [Candidatus Omnitrophota bacterium]MCE7909004.1 hemerythrin domain-containing protein [Candidatus Omnitrophica bacterium COP1]
MSDKPHQKPDFQGVARSSMEEHDKLHQTIGELRACAEQAKSSQQEKHLEALGEWLKEFKVIMRRHMDFEEADGFMRPVVEIRPTLAGRVEEIRAEHDQVWETLNELIGAIDNPGQSSFWPRDVPDATLALLDQIIHHEEKENTIILDVFIDDVGTKD